MRRQHLSFMLTRHICRALAAAVVTGATAGCSLALSAPAIVDGQYFAVEEAARLRAGMSPEQVEAVLGTPLRRSEGSAEWRYDFTRRLRECRPYLGPVPLQRARTERHTLELTFGGSGLERAVYRQAVPGRMTDRVLVGAVEALQ